MDPALLVQALGQVLDSGDTQVTVADVDWARFAPPFTVRRPSPLIESLPEVRQALDAVAADSGPAAPGAGTGLERQLAGRPVAEQDRILVDLVRAEAAEILGHTSLEGVAAELAFSEMGFDSLTSVDLRNRLNTATGLQLPATLLFDYPNPPAVASLLRSRLAGVPGADPVTSAAPVTASGEPIAIVAMGCRFPGGVREPGGPVGAAGRGRGRDLGIPADRGWDLDGCTTRTRTGPGPCTCGQGGFLHDADEFDAGFFGISPREALAMDPQQRLLLETSLGGVRAGRHRPVVAARQPDRRVRRRLARRLRHGRGHAGRTAEGHLLTGNAASVISGRVAYALGLEGPAVTVDTACSSSLVALHLACQALRRGECSLALAGGVTVMATPAVFVEFSRQRGLAADGRCKAFAARRRHRLGEGAGLLLLERLSDARRNGHPVLAVVRAPRSTRTAPPTA